MEGLGAHAAAEAEVPARIDDSPVVKAAVALSLSIFLIFSIYGATWYFTTSAITDRVLYYLSAFSPFFVAWGLGLSLPRLRLTSYALLGLIAGTFGLALRLLVFGHYNAGEIDPTAKSLLFIYAISGILSFVTGGALGERMRGRNASGKSEFISSAVNRLLRDPQSRAQVTTVIQALAPILGIILNAIFIAIGYAPKHN
jgi:hypothetical protein